MSNKTDDIVAAIKGHAADVLAAFEIEAKKANCTVPELGAEVVLGTYFGYRLRKSAREGDTAKAVMYASILVRQTVAFSARKYDAKRAQD